VVAWRWRLGVGWSLAAMEVIEEALAEQEESNRGGGMLATTGRGGWRTCSSVMRRDGGAVGKDKEPRPWVGLTSSAHERVCVGG
jgi:hypothetical protein